MGRWRETGVQSVGQGRRGDGNGCAVLVLSGAANGEIDTGAYSGPTNGAVATSMTALSPLTDLRQTVITKDTRPVG